MSFNKLVYTRVCVRMKRLFILALITLITLNPVVAQDSGVTCLSDSSKTTLSDLAEGNANVSQEDLEDVYGDLCQRDKTYYEFTQNEMDNFQDTIDTRINNSLEEARTDLKTYVKGQLTDMNDLATALDDLDTAIESNVEVQRELNNMSEDISGLEGRVESIENTDRKAEFREVFVTEDQLGTKINSTENWARGEFQPRDRNITFWDWAPFNKLHLFVLIVILSFGGYWGWKNDKLPEQAYDFLPDREGTELTDEEIEAIESGVQEEEEKEESVEEEVESGMSDEQLTTYKEFLEEEKENIRQKGARKSAEEEKRLEEIQEELEEIEEQLQGE